MRLKKIVMFFVAATLTVTAMVLGTMAEPQGKFEVGVVVETATPISSSPLILNQGDEITVKVSVKENSGISYVDMVLNYDPNALEYVSHTTDAKGTVTPISDPACIRYQFNDPTGTPNVYVGDLYTVTFQVKEGFCGSIDLAVSLARDNKNNCLLYDDQTAYKLVPFSSDTQTALIHKIDTEGVVTEPTCGKDGYTTYTCSACEASVVGNIVATAGHDLVSVEAKDPTCLEAGWAAYEYCTKCDYTTYAKLPVADHTEVIDEAKAPTCTETGLTEGKHCSVCNEVLVAQDTINALGHTEVADAAQEPTCTETGLTAGVHCSTCNDALVPQQIIAALGHTEVIDAGKAATCTETGLTEGKHCSVCDEVLVAQEIIDALGHTEVINAGKAATCTEDGLTDGKHCSVCNDVLAVQEVIAALGHTEVVDAAKDATCTEAGLTEGKHCSVCNEVLVAQNEIPAAHEYGEWIAEIPAEIGKEGALGHYHCSKCNSDFDAQYGALSSLVIPALPEETLPETEADDQGGCGGCSSSGCGSSGCGSTVSIAVILMVGAAAVALRKKED